MSSEQKQFSEIYGWFGLAIIIVILVLLPFSIRKSTNTMHKVCSLLTIFNLYLVLCTCTNKWFLFLKVKTKPQNISFTASGASVYIPEVKSDSLPYPLIACSVTELNNSELFYWNSPYHPHVDFDLTLDAQHIMKKSDEYENGQIARLAFGKVRYWDPSIVQVWV